MPRKLLILPLLVLFGLSPIRAADAPADRAATSDKALLGTWAVTSAEYRGEKSAEPVGSTFTFTADQITMKKKGKDKAESTAAYVVDASASPKRLDLTPLDDAGKIDINRTLRGIYSVDGDTLKICMNDRPGDRRPPSLESTRDSTAVLLVLKRQK